MCQKQVDGGGGDLVEVQINRGEGRGCQLARMPSYRVTRRRSSGTLRPTRVVSRTPVAKALTGAHRAEIEGSARRRRSAVSTAACSPPRSSIRIAIKWAFLFCPRCVSGFHLDIGVAPLLTGNQAGIAIVGKEMIKQKPCRGAVL